MNRIDEMINWYKENASRREYTVIKAKLKLIRSMYEEIKNSEDRIFMEEIIDRFSDIVELQNTVISDREMELESLAAAGSGCNTSSFIALRQDGFRDDKQLQAAFADYLSKKKKKPLSSYTINDYCSRIRNVWKSFYADYLDGSLQKELAENVETVNADNPLVNALNNIEELCCYAEMCMHSENGRNWANAIAALNNFADFAAESSKNVAENTDPLAVFCGNPCDCIY